jgi:hypothetical protein
MFDRIRLLIKECWEYSIVIFSMILLFILASIFSYLFSIKSDDIKRSLNLFFFSHIFFFALSFIFLTLVICLLITNIKYKKETKQQIFYYYCKVGLIIPIFILVVFSIIFILSFLLGKVGNIGVRNIDNMFWFMTSLCMIAAVTVPICIAIGYFIRFILTVKPLSNFFSPTLRVITVLLTGVLAIFLVGTMEGVSDDFIMIKKGDSIREISFSPDGEKIIFNRQKCELPDMINIYNLETGDLMEYQPPEGEYWTQARYSPEGGKIVFVTMTYKQDEVKHSEAQIAVMDIDGRNLKKITQTDGRKDHPSFSHSGKKIIFSGVGIKKEHPQSSSDVYEVDLETGEEIRLTHFKFELPINAYYFPDDKTFVFDGGQPGTYPGLPEKSDFKLRDRYRGEWESKYMSNTIYAMQANEKELKPYIVTGRYSITPALSADGSVLVFKSRGYSTEPSSDWAKNRLPVYLYSPDGNHRKIINHPVKDIAVSPHGESIGVVEQFSQYRDVVAIYQIKNGTKKEIILPDRPSSVIKCE